MTSPAERLSISLATEVDFEPILAIDPIRTDHRADEIRTAIQNGELWIAVDENTRVAGYVVFDHSFLHQPFVSLLIVAEPLRRSGIGGFLLSHIERLCTGPKLFTSTNASNVPAQQFFRKAGFTRVGQIDGLDDDDPEIFLLKRSESGESNPPPRGA